MADGVQPRSQRRKRAGSWMDGSHTQEKSTNGATAGGGVESRIRRKFVAKTKHSVAAASAGAGGGAGAATAARQAPSTAAARATKPSAQDDAGSSSSVVQPGPRKRARRRVAPEHRAALSMLSHMPQMTGQFSTARTKAKQTKAHTVYECAAATLQLHTERSEGEDAACLEAHPLQMRRLEH